MTTQALSKEIIVPPALRIPLSLAAFALAVLAATAPVAAATAQATAAATTPPAAGSCGNGLFEPAETCAGCPADCRPAACKDGTRQTVTIDLTPQEGFDKVGAVTVLVGYRQGVLTLPGERNDPAVAARVKPRTAGSQVFVNDLGYALRVVVSNADGLPAGALVDVDLDTCAGASAPQPADLSCAVEACAKGGARLRLCGCSARLP